MSAKSKKRLRVGAVAYLNTKPLVHRLREFVPGIDLVFDLPSRLADRLRADHLDVALIPSIEFTRDPGYVILSDACIGCRGPVLSVKLLSRTPMHAIRRLALDEGSRTSGVLARILLYERFGLQPQLEPLPIAADLNDCDADAILLIGDRAIHLPDGGFVEQWDLGDQWCRWAELPFVFAMWVGRAGRDFQTLETGLNLARDAGCNELNLIAEQNCRQVGLSQEQTLHYLRDNLHFFLGSRERRGLELYYRHAAKLGEVPAAMEC